MSRVTRFILLTVALAAVATGLLAFLSPTPSEDQVRAAVLLGLLGAFTDSIGYTLARNTTGSIAYVPYVAATALAPTWTTVVVIAGVSLVEGIVLRRELKKTAFNAAQFAASAAIAALLFGTIGGAPLLTEPRFSVLQLAVLLGGFLLTNSLLVSGVIAAHESRALWPIWKTTKASTIVYDVLAIPFVWFFARVYVEYGLIGPVLLILPLLGARQLYKTNWQLAQANQELLELMVAAIEARDPYTSGHSRRVSKYARAIARAAGLTTKQADRVSVAALLHDVGKIHEVFATLLRKTDRLTDDEMRVMQTHPVKSAELVANVTQLRDVVDAIRHHHECWNGTGYPSGLAGEAIPLASRVIIIADTIDAMTTDRPYRRAMTIAEVRAELGRCQGSQFDPTICSAFLSTGLLEELLTDEKLPRTAKTTPKAFAVIRTA